MTQTCCAGVTQYGFIITEANVYVGGVNSISMTNETICVQSIESSQSLYLRFSIEWALLWLTQVGDCYWWRPNWVFDSIDNLVLLSFCVDQYMVIDQRCYHHRHTSRFVCMWLWYAMLRAQFLFLSSDFLSSLFMLTNGSLISIVDRRRNDGTSSMRTNNTFSNQFRGAEIEYSIESKQETSGNIKIIFAKSERSNQSVAAWLQFSSCIISINWNSDTHFFRHPLHLLAVSIVFISELQTFPQSLRSHTTQVICVQWMTRLVEFNAIPSHFKWIVVPFR